MISIDSSQPGNLSRRVASCIVALCCLATLLAALPNITSAGVCAGDTILTSQAQVDSFTCSEVTVSLVIIGAGITQVDSLSSLTSVGGNLTIRARNLVNVDGLSSVQHVGGGLEICSTQILVHVDGLASLTSVGHLDIRTNASLQDLDGLSSLETIHGDLLVGTNLALLHLDGLASLVSVGGQLNFASNLALVQVDGLASLTSVTEGVYVADHPSLERCCGLFPLLSGNGVGGTVTFAANGSGCNAAQDIIDAGSCIVAVDDLSWSGVKVLYR